MYWRKMDINSTVCKWYEKQKYSEDAFYFIYKIMCKCFSHKSFYREVLMDINK